MIARQEDEPEMLAFFDAEPDQTIWLRICGAGRGRFSIKREDGRIVAMSTHAKNGLLHVFAPVALAEVVNEAVRPDAKVVGVAGPPAQMRQAIELLGFARRPVFRLSQEIIMSVTIDDIVPPPMLSQPGVVVRRATTADEPLLVEWRKHYFQEVHRIVANQELIDEVAEYTREGRLWVLEDNGTIGNTMAFSAVFPRIAQLEYGYSPPEHRSKKYLRTTTAGSCLLMRKEGVERAVFNTDVANYPLHNSLVPIGFRKTADYHVTVFAD